MRNILLMSFREDETMRMLDDECFRRTGGLQVGELRTWSVLQDAAIPRLEDVDGIIIGGSRLSVFDEYDHRDLCEGFVRSARTAGVPMLGICFGHQLLAQVFGGEVIRDQEREEFGSFAIDLLPAAESTAVFAGLPNPLWTQCSHRDRVSTLPEGAKLLAQSKLCSIHAFGWPEEGVYGVQFHPELNREMAEAGRIRGAAKHDTNTSQRVWAPLRATPEAEGVVRKWVGVCE